MMLAVKGEDRRMASSIGIYAILFVLTNFVNKVNRFFYDFISFLWFKFLLIAVFKMCEIVYLLSFFCSPKRSLKKHI